MERRAKEREENGEIEIEEKDKESTTTKPEGEEKLFKFPLGTVKRIIKMDPDVNVISKDSIFLITKALEMFVESLSIEAYSYTAGAKKKTLSKQDVEKAIDAVDALAFLDGALDD
jgi:DNA polymerase epsilon subunit 4